MLATKKLDPVFFNKRAGAYVGWLTWGACQDSYIGAGKDLHLVSDRVAGGLPLLIGQFRLPEQTKCRREPDFGTIIELVSRPALVTVDPRFY